MEIKGFSILIHFRMYFTFAASFHVRLRVFFIKFFLKIFAIGFRGDENIFPRTIYWKNLIIILLVLWELHFLFHNSRFYAV